MPPFLPRSTETMRCARIVCQDEEQYKKLVSDTNNKDGVCWMRAIRLCKNEIDYRAVVLFPITGEQAAKLVKRQVFVNKSHEYNK